MATEHQYRPLNISRNEIRVVHLAPSCYRTAKVSCSLTCLSLDDNIRFEALSYTWGDADVKRTINLNGQDFLVTRNLEIALQHLRYVNDDRYLWIDAICINQNDTSERNQQVSKMGQIYRKAAKVVVWLGLASENSDVALDFSLEACANRHRMQAWMLEVMKSPDRARHWKAAVNLFERDYWRRIWIIQEIFFAKYLIVRCGFRCIRWSDFILLYSSLRNAYQFLISQNDRHTLAGKNIGSATTLANLQNRVILPVYVEQCKKNAENSKTLQHEPLIQLLMSTRNSLSSDPRDKVYAIAGMAVQYNDNRALKVDYTLSTVETYIETARILIERNKNCSGGPVGIICASKPHLSNVSLPSWVPDWSTPPGRVSYGGLGTMIGIFNANGDSPPKPTFNIDSGVLTVRGIKVTVIDHLGTMPLYKLDITGMNQSEIAGYASGSNGPESVFFAARSLAMSTSRDMRHSTKPLEVRKEFTRTITLNHGMPSLAHGTEIVATNVVIDTLSEDTIQKFSQEVVFQVAPGEILGKYMHDIEHAAHRGLLSMALNNLRTFRFCVSSDGSFVMGSPVMRKGDLVCVLFGSDMPVVLREIGEKRYVFVGDCYIHGIMDGEAIERMRAGKYKAEEFRIY